MRRYVSCIKRECYCLRQAIMPHTALVAEHSVDLHVSAACLWN